MNPVISYTYPTVFIVMHMALFLVDSILFLHGRRSIAATAVKEHAQAIDVYVK